MTDAEEIVKFWLSAGPEKWYAKDDAFDQVIRDRFGPVWHAAHAGEMPDWASDAPGALALLIVLDQFPRNMFRDDARAFATDAKALALASHCVAQGWDREIPEPERQFFYMPFMHAEDMDHQNTCVDLFETRMTGANSALHARVHREIIARFGRFPYRNAVLGRETTPEEQAFLDGGGYGEILRELDPSD